jgi:hypothetical protein
MGISRGPGRRGGRSPRFLSGEIRRLGRAREIAAKPDVSLAPGQIHFLSVLRAALKACPQLISDRSKPVFPSFHPKQRRTSDSLFSACRQSSYHSLSTRYKRMPSYSTLFNRGVSTINFPDCQNLFFGFLQFFAVFCIEAVLVSKIGAPSTDSAPSTCPRDFKPPGAIRPFGVQRSMFDISPANSGSAAVPAASDFNLEP